jgi:hypothetical protein
MRVAVMNIGVMRMGMRHCFVPVRMYMRFFAIPCEVMFMPMMLVMTMLVSMLHGFMLMGMVMVLSQVQPDSRAHQCRRYPK